MATEYRRDSLYKSTTIENNKYLDIWDPTVSDIKNVSTQSYTIEPRYSQRPDKLANDLYGNPKLWWAFALINQDKLNDPIMDFTSGLSIEVPIRFT
jgi:hypothetical protein